MLTVPESLDDDLSPVWEEISLHLAERDLPLFPDIPNVARTAFALWPDTTPTGWRAFLDLAVQLGVPIVYGRVERFGDRNGDDPLVVHASNVDQVSQRPTAAGAIVWITLAYVSGGVVHTWDCGVEWLDDLVDEHSPEQSASVTDLFGQDVLDGLVEKMIATPGIFDARRVQWYATAEKLVEELTLTEQQRDRIHSAVHYVQSTARERIDAIKDERAQELTADPGKYAAELLDRADFAQAKLATLKRQAIRAYLTERFGFSTGLMVETLYAHVMGR